MAATDWPGVSEIYAAGIATGNATFDSTPPEWAAFDEAKLAAHRHVALDADGAVLGWVAASAVSQRPVYRGVVEHSVYVHPYAGGHGIGRALLTALIESTEAAGIWTIQSGIFPENIASLTLHARAGFRVVGLGNGSVSITGGGATWSWSSGGARGRRESGQPGSGIRVRTGGGPPIGRRPADHRR